MSDVPGINVLVVVYEEQFKRKIMSFLSAEKFHVFEPESEREVVGIFESEKTIHVAVVDIQLAEKKGLRCVEFIKHNYNKTEVIILNNTDQIGLSIQGMRLGAFDDIMVPFDMETLKEKILMAYHYGKEKQRKIAFHDQHPSIS